MKSITTKNAYHFITNRSIGSQGLSQSFLTGMVYRNVGVDNSQSERRYL